MIALVLTRMLRTAPVFLFARDRRGVSLCQSPKGVREPGIAHQSGLTNANNFSHMVDVESKRDTDCILISVCRDVHHNAQQHATAIAYHTHKALRKCKMSPKIMTIAPHERTEKWVDLWQK